MGIRSLIQKMHLEWRSESSSLTAFHYDPLPEPKNYIRLLELLPSNDGVVSCRLTQWLVSEAPSYCAISYTWGDTLDTTRIHVNGQEVIVRKNCEYALRQAQGQRGDRYLWVDSICINQTDDDEKGHQVAMMGDIFSRASHVRACVGPHDGESEWLLAFCRRHARFLEQMFIMRGAPKGSKSHYTRKLRYYRAYQRRWVLRRLTTVQRLVQALNNLFERPYFSRLWVFQELCLAGTNTMLCCGDARRPLRHVWMLSYLIAVSLRTVAQGEPFPHHPLTISTALFYSPGSKRLDESLRHILSATADLKCEDPRDKVYGILSVINWGSVAPPQPDYRLTTFQVAEKLLGSLPGDTYDVGRFQGIINWIAQGLRLSPYDSADMRAALNQRRTQLDQFSPLVTSRELASSQSSRSTVAIKGWQAFRLQKSVTFSPSGPVQQTKSEHSCKYAARHVKALIGHPTTPDRYQTASWLDVLDVVDAVRSMSSPFHLFLPPATEAGDWVLRSFRLSQDMQRCLVVRKVLGENVLCVVGQGIYVRGSYDDADTLGSDTSDDDGFEVDTDCDDADFMFSARRVQFCVTFDVEDLLVFMSQPGLNLSDAGDACGDLIFERLNTGVCGRINSSFAKRIK